jgi:transcription elongation factor Elf1
MYGRKRYRRNKSVDKSVAIPESAIPTFLCPRCGSIKNINMPHIEITALEKGKLFLYTKLCGSCAELLKTWLKNVQV